MEGSLVAAAVAATRASVRPGPAAAAAAGEYRDGVVIAGFPQKLAANREVENRRGDVGVQDLSPTGRGKYI